MPIAITHTAAEGTLLAGTSRGDGSAPHLRQLGWRWGRSIQQWFIPRSRDIAPKRRIIDPTVERLREAGFEVVVTITHEHRDPGAIEADRRGRAAARAEHFEASAERHAQRADALHERAHQDASSIPFDQPILVGHHSEGRDRRFRENIRRTFDRAGEERSAAEYAQHRATSARSRAERPSPVTIANKVRKLEAEQRAWQRRARETRSQEYQVRANDEAARLGRTITYWREQREAMIDEGLAQEHDPSTISTGDEVRISGSWWRVERVNPKTVTVASHGSRIRAPYDNITGHRPS